MACLHFKVKGNYFFNISFFLFKDRKTYLIFCTLLWLIRLKLKTDGLLCNREQKTTQHYGQACKHTFKRMLLKKYQIIKGSQSFSPVLTVVLILNQPSRCHPEYSSQYSCIFHVIEQVEAFLKQNIKCINFISFTMTLTTSLMYR